MIVAYTKDDIVRLVLADITNMNKTATAEDFTFAFEEKDVLVTVRVEDKDRRNRKPTLRVEPERAPRPTIQNPFPPLQEPQRTYET